MRAGILLGLLILGPCDKETNAGGDAAPSSTPSATATVAATATTTATTPAVNAGTAATPSTGAKTVGTTISGNGKTVALDGGNLTLVNDAGLGTVTQTDAGVVLKGKDGKTLTLPPIPGVK